MRNDMEYTIKCADQSGGCHRLASISVEKGRVVSATPSFEWAIGGGLHAVLSWCARRQIRWERRRDLGQLELGL